MIDRIIIENFKSLRKVDLSLGRLNLFIGANASGKSNFLEALRILQGIGNGFNMGEVLNGRPRSATSQVWEGIRGGSARTAIAGTEGIGEVAIAVYGRLKEEPHRKWNYRIAYSPAHAWVTRERLEVEDDFYESAPVSEPWHAAGELVVKYSGARERRMIVNAWPLLGQLSTTPFHEEATHAGLAASVAGLLANSQALDPSPQVLRQYSPAHAVGRMGDHGEDFAALVSGICSDEKKKDAYLSWLRELRPEQVDDVGTLSGAVGEPMFMLVEHLGDNKRRLPAPVLSDGTLRFAAITAAFFQLSMPNMFTIEEVEKGIHASRLRLLVELLRSQTAASNTQVFATTHSASVLAWLRESDYRTTFICAKDETTGDSTIRPVTDVPHFAEVTEKVPLPDLFAEGWLEAAL